MSSNIRLEKTCQFCGEYFTAKTTVTQFCSDDCAKKAYKKRKRDQKIHVAVKKETDVQIATLSEKHFLTIEEACKLINASRWTIYRLIEKGRLQAGGKGRLTRIPKTSIDQFFKTPAV
ncbi:MAG TPA: helix-turn-helix domain-containing protein [Chitinophagaceae bacterium]|nr:helix-turn-helix domain-containing protein [Chitinophagaceae bacterium]